MYQLLQCSNTFTYNMVQMNKNLPNVQKNNNIYKTYLIMRRDSGGSKLFLLLQKWKMILGRKIHKDPMQWLAGKQTDPYYIQGISWFYLGDGNQCFDALSNNTSRYFSPNQSNNSMLDNIYNLYNALAILFVLVSFLILFVVNGILFSLCWFLTLTWIILCNLLEAINIPIRHLIWTNTLHIHKLHVTGEEDAEEGFRAFSLVVEYIKIVKYGLDINITKI